MKKLVFSFGLLLGLFFSASAQTDKSTLLLGGALSFQSSTGSSIFVASPNVGVFIKKNIAIGAQFDLITTNSLTSWSIGPYVRGYFAGTEKGSFFGQGGISVGGSSVGSTSSDTDVRFLVKGGYAVFLNKTAALEFSAGYNAGKGTDFFLMGVGLQIHLKK